MTTKSAVVHDASAQIRTRHRVQLRRRLIRTFVPLVCLALIAAAVWALWFSDWFVAASIEVSGAVRVTREEIVTAAEIEFGTPLMRLDVEAIASRVSQIPVVAAATVDWELSGVVRIAVTERVAVYNIPSAGEYLLVDATGTGYLRLDEPESYLPVVIVAHDESSQSQRLMADAAVIVMALPESVRSKMELMTASTPDTFSIRLENNATVFWGGAEQSELKAEVVDGLLKVKATYYDVSSPGHPATR